MIICTSGDCLNKICGHRRCTGGPLWCAGHSTRLPSRFCQWFCLILGGRIVQKFCSEWKSRQFSPIYDHRGCFLKKKLQKCSFSRLTALIFWLGSVSRSYQQARWRWHLADLLKLSLQCTHPLSLPPRGCQKCCFLNLMLEREKKKNNQEKINNAKQLDRKTMSGMKIFFSHLEK